MIAKMGIVLIGCFGFLITQFKPLIVKYLPFHQSSLLMVLLGELSVSSGERKVSGKIGYASQQPWIFSGTIKQNILFGEEFIQERYLNVIEACALQKVGNHFIFLLFPNFLFLFKLYFRYDIV